MRLEILKNESLKHGFYLLELAAPAGFKRAAPGQFLHIRITDSCDPFLRRPLSIHDCYTVSGGRLRVKVLYEIAGKGTKLLAQKLPSADLDCLGPLGRGFDLERLLSNEKIYIVAGGMGVAPLFFLAKKIREYQNPKSKIQILVLIGASTKEQVLCEQEFRKLGCEVRVAAEDGSEGFKGRVTDLLKEILAASRKPQTANQKAPAVCGLKPGACSLQPVAMICACGPKPMLAVISEIARQHKLPAYVALEEFMGCGLGACLGCVIRTKSGYKRVCHDGPVFEAGEIVWE